MTKGEYRVGLSFNPSGNQMVDDIKAQAAALIDLIDRIDPSAEPAEIEALKGIAEMKVEEAAMWAVKAATKGPWYSPAAAKAEAA